jgi:hypothetical protein
MKVMGIALSLSIIVCLFIGDLLAGNKWRWAEEEPSLLITITMAAGTTGSAAQHEILTVTGLCEIKILTKCTTNVAGSGSIQLGWTGTTNGIIASTTGTNVNAGAIWNSTSADILAGIEGDVLFTVVSNGADIGYEITSATLTGGVLVFYIWWTPLEDDAFCAVATGAAGTI